MTLRRTQKLKIIGKEVKIQPKQDINNLIYHFFSRQLYFNSYSYKKKNIFNSNSLAYSNIDKDKATAKEKSNKINVNYKISNYSLFPLCRKCDLVKGFPRNSEEFRDDVVPKRRFESRRRQMSYDFRLRYRDRRR